MVLKAQAVSCEESRWAWLAGLIDGDGSFTVHGRGSAHIEISMTDKNTIDFLQATFGGNVYTPHKARPNARQYWKWIVGPTWMRENLRHLVPWLVTKKSRALLIVEYLTVRMNAGGTPVNAERAEQIRKELKTLNARGLQAQAS